MSLKELTWENHKSAERKKFAGILMSGSIDPFLYYKYLTNQYYMYVTLESKLPLNRLEIADIRRAGLMRMDLLELELKYGFDKDKYPQGFHDFFKKWKKHKSKNYYVQFSNHKDNTLDKTSYSDPTHSDPKGNYGYPLQYVIDYPMDIWYGANAKYLRVLESTANNILYLNDICGLSSRYC